MRKKIKGAGPETHSTRGPCSICGRVHPRGKQKKNKWGGCQAKPKVEPTSVKHARFTPEETKARQAKLSRLRERHAQQTIERQQQAEQRLKAWNKLNSAQQLLELDKRPGESKRQRERILARMT